MLSGLGSVHINLILADTGPLRHRLEVEVNFHVNVAGSVTVNRFVDNDLPDEPVQDAYVQLLNVGVLPDGFYPAAGVLTKPGLICQQRRFRSSRSPSSFCSSCARFIIRSKFCSEIRPEIMSS